MGLDISLYLARTTETDTTGLSDNIKKIINNETDETIGFLPLGDFRKYYTLHEKVNEYLKDYQNCSYAFINIMAFIDIAKRVIKEDKDDYEKGYDEKLKMIIEALERKEVASSSFDIVYWAWW